MPWTNWGEQLTREEMLNFVKQIRNRCDMVLTFKPVDYLLYTLLEDIFEDAQAIATGYSAHPENEKCEHIWGEGICLKCGVHYDYYCQVYLKDKVVKEKKIKGWWKCELCGKTHSSDIMYCPLHGSQFPATDFTGDE